MKLEIISISKEPSFSKDFSICTIVSNKKQYNELLESLWENGFNNQNSEFFVADNTDQNSFDAFSAIQSFLFRSSGRYVMIVHQDVIVCEQYFPLLGKLEKLSVFDDKWGVVGNAGKPDGEFLIGKLSLTTHQGDYSINNEFQKVQSLDENLLIIKNGLGIGISTDLSGFHFYGFDITSIAKRLGYNSYVINTKWIHYSPGNIGEDFVARKKIIIYKMNAYMNQNTCSTTCTDIYWGNDPARSIISMWRSIHMLNGSVHKNGQAIFFKEQNIVCRFLYKCYSMFRIISFFIRFRIKVLLKIYSWHYSWWKENWKTRILIYNNNKKAN